MSVGVIFGVNVGVGVWADIGMGVWVSDGMDLPPDLHIISLICISLAYQKWKLFTFRNLLFLIAYLKSTQHLTQFLYIIHHSYTSGSKVTSN